MADDDLNGFTDEQVAKLRAMYEAWSGESSDTLHRRGRRPLMAARVIVGALTSSVAAISGLMGTPTVGTLNVYSFSSTGTEDTGIDEKVYNFAPSAATTDRWTVCERCNITGRWVITTQFCS